MRLTRLNLSALQERLVGIGTDIPGTWEERLSRANGYQFSRRGALGVAGTAVAGASPTLKMLETTLLKPLEVVSDRRRAVFKVGARECWVIDTRRFGGHPVLKVERAERHIRVTLRGATYPGTALPADLAVDLREGLVGWRLRLTMALGGFTAEVSAQRWLEGKETARSQVRLERSICKLGATSGVAFDGSGEATFDPSWTLTVQGGHIARLLGFDGPLVTDSMSLALLSPHDPSLVSQPEDKRTRIILERGTQVWRLASLLSPRVEKTQAGAHTGTLVADGSPFDRITIEAGETGARGARRALLAEGGQELLSFQPDGHLVGSDGKPFQLPLTHPRYARTFGSSRDETALVAEFHPTATWLRVDRCSLAVGHDGETNLFELIGHNGKMRLTCAPALLSVMVPLEGAIVEPSHLPAGTRLELVSGTARHARHPSTARLRTHPDKPDFFEFTMANLVVSLLRPDDLLALQIELFNFSLQTANGQPATLVRTDPSAASYLVVHFPAQHIAEQAFLDGGATPALPGQVQSRLAGTSRLAFSVDPSITTLPYTLEALLDWGSSKYTLNVSPLATPLNVKPNTAPGGVYPSPATPPDVTQTDIEAPWRLHLSPTAAAGWIHSIAPVTFDGRTELWHTRLGIKDGNGVAQDIPLGATPPALPTLRAIYSPDYTPASAPPLYTPSAPPTAADPFLNSLAANDRYGIVGASADFNLQGGAYNALPVNAERFMLSSLGAWMAVQGAWDPTVVPSSTLEAWRHQMGMGRDAYVRVVHKGYLLPFRHRASFLTITERKFVQISPSFGTTETVAYLLQRSFIVVRQPERTYIPDDYPIKNGSWPANYRGNDMALRRVRITTLTTPDIAMPTETAGTPSGTEQAFWAKYNGADGTQHDILYHLVAEDWLGQEIEFTAPLLFVSGDLATTDDTNLATVISAYNNDERRIIDMAHQQIALAPKSSVPLPNATYPGGAPPPDTSHETDTIEFNAAPFMGTAPLPNLDDPHFYPSMKTTNLHIPAVKQLLALDTSQAVQFHSTYLSSGLDPAANAGQVFAKLPSPPLLTFGKSVTGALVTPGVGKPDFNIKGLSATMGAFANNPDILAAAAAKFDPNDAFGAILSAKILGGIKLKDIFGAALDLGNAPQLITNKIPDAIDTNYTWTTPVTNQVLFFHPFYEALDSSGNAANGTAATMSLTALVHTPIPKNGPPQPPAYSIVGTLANFTLDFGVIALPFHSLVFTVESGKKMNVNADTGDVFFGSFLKFVNELEKFFKSFSDPPYLDIEPEFIEAGYKQSIPDITLGAFSLQNIALGAAIRIPFFGDPINMRFNFATRDHPFILTVYIFGGGGFLQLGVGPGGLETLEASLEFGANFAIDIVIAQGSVHAMAGIYMKWDLASGSGSLTGFLDIGGSLEILGLITVSVEFYLGFTYDTKTNAVTGEASLTVEVDVLFFSKSVTLGPIRKTFGGSGSSARELFHTDSVARAGLPAHPTVGNMLAQGDWTTYCQAFAA